MFQIYVLNMIYKHPSKLSFVLVSM